MIIDILSCLCFIQEYYFLHRSEGTQNGEEKERLEEWKGGWERSGSVEDEKAGRMLYWGKNMLLNGWIQNFYLVFRIVTEKIQGCRPYGLVFVAFQGIGKLLVPYKGLRYRKSAGEWPTSDDNSGCVKRAIWREVGRWEERRHYRLRGQSNESGYCDFWLSQKILRALFYKLLKQSTEQRISPDFICHFLQRK